MPLQVLHIANPNDNEHSPTQDSRVTINPYCLRAVASEDVEINGTKLKRLTIFFVDGGILQLNMSSFDAIAVEETVGLVPEF